MVTDAPYPSFCTDLSHGDRGYRRPLFSLVPWNRDGTWGDVVILFRKLSNPQRGCGPAPEAPPAPSARGVPTGPSRSQTGVLPVKPAFRFPKWPSVRAAGRPPATAFRGDGTPCRTQRGRANVAGPWAAHRRAVTCPREWR